MILRRTNEQEGKAYPSNINIQGNELTPEEQAAKDSNAYYQAQMDWQRGGKEPNQAFTDRGFKKNSRGNWVFDR